MAKNKEQENSDTGSDIDTLLEQQLTSVKGDSGDQQLSKKPIRAMKTINADGRLLAAYEALRKEGYKKSFDDFLVDASMFFAKGKYGLDFVIEKSLTPDDTDQYLKVRKKDDGEDNGGNKNNSSVDPYDLALKLLTGGTSTEDPRVQVLNMLLEQKRLDMEERKIRIEREELENEKIKTEIEKLKTENKKPPVEETTKHNDGNMEILKFMFDQNQKFYQTMAELYKSGMPKENNNNQQMELYKTMAEQQKEYYQTITNLLQGQQAEKISELERYVASLNPSVWLSQKAEEFKTYKEIFGGGGGKSPEEIEREYQLRLEELRMKHEDTKEQREAERAMQITQTIKDGFSAFSEQIGKPLGEAIASRLRESSQPKPNPSMPSQPPEQTLNNNVIRPYKIPLNDQEQNTAPQPNMENNQTPEQQMQEYDIPITAYVKKTEVKDNDKNDHNEQNTIENINEENQ